MESVAIIGLNHGDEGKGLMTDYFCDKFMKKYGPGKGLNIRFNGGAQAGHTVVTPDGKRHVFKHFGAGSFTGVQTYLAPDFILNPILFKEEHLALQEFGLELTPLFDSSSPCTTPWDMMFNQFLEKSRNPGQKHGSCGVGIGATMFRQNSGQKFHPLFRTKDESLKVRGFWAEQLLRQQVQVSEEDLDSFFSDEVLEHFLDCCGYLQSNALVVGPKILEYQDFLVFEGAQGLRLDMDYKPGFPHVTYSKTDMTNIHKLGVKDVKEVYITRAYDTRHGAGPFSNWISEPGNYVKEGCKTNTHHDFQGHLRYGPLDLTWVADKCFADSLALTHFDNIPEEIEVVINGKRKVVTKKRLLEHLEPQYLSEGPTRSTIHEQYLELV